jgi:ankyrin repeat protein
VDIVAYLLRISGPELVNLTDSQGQTPLHYAAQGRNLFFFQTWSYFRVSLQKSSVEKYYSNHAYIEK